MLIHTPTLLLVVIAASLAYALALAYAAYTRSRDLLLCSGALALHAVAFVFYAMNGHVPAVIPIFFGNAALSATFALFCESVYVHHSWRPPRWLIWLPVWTLPVLFLLWLDDVRMRVVVGSAVFSAQCVLSMVGLLRERRHNGGRGQYIVMLGLSLTLINFAVRLVAMGSGLVVMHSLADSNLMQSATFLNSIVAITLISLGLILMSQERLTQALQHSDEFTRGILNSVPSQIAVLDRGGRVVALNEAWREHGSAQMPCGIGTDYLSLLPKMLPGGESEAVAGVSEVLSGQRHSYSVEYEVPTKSEAQWFLLSVTPMRSAQGGAVAVHTEITANKQAENFKHFRSEVLNLLAAAQPMEKVLMAIVQGIEQLHPAMVCSILLLDEGKRRLGHGIAPSLPAFFNEATNGLEIGMGVGSCGTAAFTGERVVVDNIASHPYWAPFREMAARAGLGACWSQPILSSAHEVLGTFAIYHREPHVPSVDDIELIEQSARLASISIERSRAASELKRSEEHYRLLIESANEGIAVAQDGVLRFVNPRLLDLLGYSKQELVGDSFLKFIHEDDHAMVLSNHERRLSGQAKDLTYPLRIVTKHHGVRWFDMSGTRFDWDGRPATLNFLNDITERREMEERIRQMAYHDTLTQLGNRRLLLDHLGLALASHQRSGRYGALMFLDLDRFKELNDTQGHTAGDLLLVEVAQRLKRSVRAADTVARFGGDEFVVMLSDLHEDLPTSWSQARTVADKILATLSEPYRLSVPARSGQAMTVVEHRCSASIGVVLFLSQPGSEDELFKLADAAMYKAKGAGRNTVHFAELPV